MLSLYGNNVTVLLFNPKLWGEVERFMVFHQTTHKFGGRARSALHGVTGHFERASQLCLLAKGMTAALEGDRHDLLRNGVSVNPNAASLTAILEAAVIELYSAVDCTRQVVYAVYKGTRGTPDSTTKFFGRAREGKLEACIPELIRNAFACADWFHGLRRLRDAVVHSNVGFCTLNGATGKVAYSPRGVADEGRPEELSDAFATFDRWSIAVNAFIGSVFHALNQNLNDAPITVLCGWFNGRAYQRQIRNSEALDAHSGRCASHSWFESDDNPACPYIGSCGAFRRAKLKITNLGVSAAMPDS